MFLVDEELDLPIVLGQRDGQVNERETPQVRILYLLEEGGPGLDVSRFEPEIVHAALAAIFSARQGSTTLQIMHCGSVGSQSL